MKTQKVDFPFKETYYCPLCKAFYIEEVDCTCDFVMFNNDPKELEDEKRCRFCGHISGVECQCEEENKEGEPDGNKE